MMEVVIVWRDTSNIISSEEINAKEFIGYIEGAFQFVVIDGIQQRPFAVENLLPLQAVVLCEYLSVGASVPSLNKVNMLFQHGFNHERYTVFCDGVIGIHEKNVFAT